MIKTDTWLRTETRLTPASLSPRRPEVLTKGQPKVVPARPDLVAGRLGNNPLHAHATMPAMPSSPPATVAPYCSCRRCGIHSRAGCDSVARRLDRLAEDRHCHQGKRQ